MTSEPERARGDHPAGVSPRERVRSHESEPVPESGRPPEIDVQSVLAFLATAPPEVRQWLADNVPGRDEIPPDAVRPDARGTTHAAVEHGDEDVDELSPDGELGEDENDDILKRAAGTTRTAGVGPAGRTRARLSTPVRFVLVAALLVGVCLGIWYAGRPAANAGASAGPTMSSQLSDAEITARIAELDAALLADPRDASAHLALGMALFYQGDLEGAREHWEAVTELDPDSAEAWYNLGFYYLSITPTDLDSAREVWQKVLDLAPDSSWAATVATHIGGLMEADPSGGSDSSGVSEPSAVSEPSTVTEPSVASEDG